MNYRKIIFAGLILFALLMPLTAFAATADSLVQEGRALLEQQKLVEANAKFKQALDADAFHQEANFFYAVTRLLNAVEVNQNGPNSGKMDSIKELLDKFGISQQGRTIYNWTADFKRDAEDDVILPSTTPKSADIQAFVLNYVLPEIDGSLANLSKIGTDFNTYITPAMSGQTDSGLVLAGNTEIDYGDIALLKAVFQIIKTSIYIETAYNTDIDIYDLYKKAKADTLKNINQLFSQYPQLLKIKRSSNFAPAKAAFADAIDLYLEASDFIRNENDDQLDDLVSIDPEDLPGENELRDTLNDIKLALNGPKDIRPGTDKYRDPTGDFIRVDLTRLFDSPASLRNYVGFTANIPCIPPDPTINGLLPYFTKYDWGRIGDNHIIVESWWHPGGYIADLSFEDHNKRATSVTAKGPGINGTMNFLYWDNYDSWFNKSDILLGPSIPLTPLKYDVTVKDQYNSCTFKKQIDGYYEDFAYNLTPDISVAPLNSSFQDVSVNNISGEKTITISNTGAAMLHVHIIDLSYAEDFAMNIYGGANPCGTSSPDIPPGGNCTVAVKFGPHSTGGKIADLAIISDDPDEETVYVSLNGTGISGEGNCFDGVDDDNDKLPDCKDPDCSDKEGPSCSTGLKGVCSAGTLTCSDGKKQCIQINQQQEEGPVGNETCSDSLDNDCDGDADLKDTHCSSIVLSVTKSGSGTGTVTSSPGGIKCGSDCAEAYAKATKVTLTAKPGSKSRFVKWTGCKAGKKKPAECTILVNGLNNVTATFKRN